MNIHSQAHNYFRTAAHSPIRTGVGANRAFDLPGGLLLWSAVGKVILCLLPVVLIANIWISSAIQGYKVSGGEIEQALLQAENESILLRTDRLKLIAPDKMMLVASEKLSLAIPGPDQIHHM